MPPLKSYGSDLPYSYAPGVFPALELMKNAPQRARRLLAQKLQSYYRENGASPAIHEKV